VWLALSQMKLDRHTRRSRGQWRMAVDNGFAGE
jgi:hypothetical protein